MHLQTEASAQELGEKLELQVGQKRTLRAKNSSSTQSFVLPKVKKTKIERKNGQAGFYQSSKLDALGDHHVTLSQSRLTAQDSSPMLKSLLSNDKNNESISLNASKLDESRPLIPGKISLPRHVESHAVLAPANLEGQLRIKNSFTNHRNSVSTSKPRENHYGAPLFIKQRLISGDLSQLNEPQSQQMSSTRNIPTRLYESAKASTSVNVLPVIGSEAKYKGALSKMSNSKIEMSKKDIQNYLVNGSISKEFIMTNKQELQKFIRKQIRASSDCFRGYETYSYQEQQSDQKTSAIKQQHDSAVNDKPHNNEYSQKSRNEPDIVDRQNSQSNDLLEMSPLEKRLVGSSTIHVDKEMPQDNDLKSKKNRRFTKSQKRGLLMDANMFPDDVRIEKRIKGEVTSRAIETWINDTLLDAHHLEIPGIVANLDAKKPIYSYGIDPHTLASAGIKEQDIDRVYRALFVYSVGFFEFLKRMLSTTSRNYAMITSIWKVYQVLLEYCCKTDYRILIAELTDRHNFELEDVKRTNHEKIETLKKEKAIIKSNLETQQDQCDVYEKERDQEKILRLKLEEEYMLNAQNHEEEVKLRLKFEGRFNQMYNDHRALQIVHDRKMLQLAKYERDLEKRTDQLTEMTKDYHEMKRLNIQQEGIISELQEFKTMADKDIRNKNNILMTAEQQRLTAIDDSHLQRYEVQESKKIINDVRQKMDIQNGHIKDLEISLEAAKLEKQVFEEERIKIQVSYDQISGKFKEREGMVETLQGQVDALKQTNGIQYAELNNARQKIERTQIAIDKLRESHAEAKAKDQTLSVSNDQLTQETKSLQQQLQQMNKERHLAEEKFSKATERAQDLDCKLDVSTKKTKYLEQTLKTTQEKFSNFRVAAAAKEENMTQQIESLKLTVEKLQSDLEAKVDRIQELNQTLQKLLEQSSEKSRVINEQKETIEVLEIQLEQSQAANKQLRFDIERAKEKVVEAESGRLLAKKIKEKAVEKRIIAEEVRDTVEKTVVTLRRQIKEERALHEAKEERYYVTMQVERERDMMHYEEGMSCFETIKAQLAEAHRKDIENQVQLENFKQTLQQLSEVQKLLDFSCHQVAVLENKVSNLEAELQKKKDEIVSINKMAIANQQKMKSNHATEVNGLEQIITKVKLNAQQQTNRGLSEKREAQNLIRELQLQITQLRAGSQYKKVSTADIAALMPQLTDATQQTNLGSRGMTKLLDGAKQLVMVQRELIQTKRAYATAAQHLPKEYTAGKISFVPSQNTEKKDVFKLEMNADYQSKNKEMMGQTGRRVKGMTKDADAMGVEDDFFNDDDIFDDDIFDDDIFDDDIFDDKSIQKQEDNSLEDIKKPLTSRLTEGHKSRLLSQRNSSTEGHHTRLLSQKNSSIGDHDGVVQNNSSSEAMVIQDNESQTHEHNTHATYSQIPIKSSQLINSGRQSNRTSIPSSKHQMSQQPQSNQQLQKKDHSEIDDEADDDIVEVKDNQVVQLTPEQQQAEQNLLRQREQQLVDFLVEQERCVLERVEQAVERGEVVPQSLVKKWRDEITLPSLLKNVKWTKDLKEHIKEKRDEQANYFQQRAIRKIEQGSAYSSDYEDVEESEYVSTDAEGAEIEDMLIEDQQKTSAQIGSGARDFSDSYQLHQPGVQTMDQPGVSTMEANDIHIAPRDLAQAQNSFEVAGQVQTQRLDEETSQPSDSNLQALGNQYDLAAPNQTTQQANNLISTDPSQQSFKDSPTLQAQMMKETAADSSQLLHKEASQGAGDHDTSVEQKVEQNFMPKIQYMIIKDSLGNNVYKRKQVKKKRVFKKRDPEYDAMKLAALKERLKNTSKQTEEKIKKTTNMYAKFAENFSKSIDVLVEKAKNDELNKARNRKKAGTNQDVDNIQGRAMNHFLIQQMKEQPAWEIHMKKLQEELKNQDSKWLNREEEQMEIERQLAEQLKAEQELERIKAIKRRERLQIIYETDQQQPGINDEDKNKKIMAEKVQKESPKGSEIFADQADQIYKQEIFVEPVVGGGVVDTTSLTSDEVHPNQSLQKNAQNPQGEDDLMLLIEEHKTRQEVQQLLDAELASFTKGGVSAVMRRSQMTRIKTENEINELQAQIESRANKRDIILAQSGHLPKKKFSEHKNPSKLGPSTIRTLIRAADSRAEL